MWLVDDVAESWGVEHGNGGNERQGHLTSVSFIDGRGFRVINRAAEAVTSAGLSLTVAARSALAGRILGATSADGTRVLVN